MSDKNNLRLYFVVMVTGMVVGIAFFGRDQAGADTAVGLIREAIVDAAQSADLNLDGAVDLYDFALFQIQMGGPIPAWLQEIIDGFEAGGVLYSAHYVWQYRYGGELVYYIPAICCDHYSTLYDIYGVRVCRPSGGFSGNGDGQCPDFFDVRTNEVLIWEDPRG